MWLRPKPHELLIIITTTTTNSTLSIIDGIINIYIYIFIVLTEYVI